VMKKAVAYLIPFMEAEKKLAMQSKAHVNGAAPDENQYAGTVLLATVKGDVHDIGKNIVGVVLGCNNYKVIDLGVMVPADRILSEAILHKVDIIGLSGLITPSLDEMVNVAREMQRKHFKIPLLIGGATTSKKHTAVKIAPAYHHPVVHVLDASRAVVVVSSLLDDSKRADFLQDLEESYKELRAEYAASQDDKKFVSIAHARNHRFKIDWTIEPAPPKPKFIGEKVYLKYPLSELQSYIDWNPFFQVWQLRGTYPNRNYPKIFNDANVGAAAKKTFDEAQSMIKSFIHNKTIEARGLVGLYPANSVGDDIVVYKDETRSEVVATFYSLRQQSEKENPEEKFMALSDFVAPKSSGIADYVGMFVVSAGFGVDEACAGLQKQHDDYRSIMTKAIADRFAEAFAEKLHEEIRRVHWGYEQQSKFSTEDLIKIKYQGIRPAPGYPSQPDHTEKSTMWKLMNVENLIGVKLTEHLAMYPAASVSALCFSHRKSSYFAVGKLCQDQINDYASRKGVKVDDAEKWLSSNLAYDPDSVKK